MSERAERDAQFGREIPHGLHWRGEVAFEAGFEVGGVSVDIPWPNHPRRRRRRQRGKSFMDTHIDAGSADEEQAKGKAEKTTNPKILQNRLVFSSLFVWVWGLFSSSVLGFTRFP